MFESLRRFFSHDMAIDLGTANTLVFVEGDGIVLQEPSVVAVRHKGGGHDQVIAVGEKARAMLGKTPDSIEAIRPIRGGVIVDFENTGVMLHYFIDKACHYASLFRPRVIICVPFGMTKVEQRAVREAALSAGAREVHLAQDPMASAIGAGLPVGEAVGSMVVDIGGGTTQVAVISLGDIIESTSIPVAGDKINEAIEHHLKHHYNLLIGDATAEAVKLKLGSCYPLEPVQTMAVRGLHLATGLPASIEVNSSEICEAISVPLATIVDAIRYVLERTPPELSADIIETGITLTGGGSLLQGLDSLICEATGLAVNRAENPLTTVALGSGKMLDSMDEIPREFMAH